jgi:isoquinoline 1-oxidoreductase beta subunit
VKLAKVSRRNLLIGGGAGIGLVVAFLAWPKRETSPLRPESKETVFGAFLRIATNGRVTVAVPQVETGQGIWTGLAQIAADELGAAWENMSVEPAPRGSAYLNKLIGEELEMDTRITAGSSSIRAFEQPLREAAATARTLLCEAAARRWGVSADECDTDGGFVLHEGKSAGFGEVAPDAARLRPPDNPVLRTIEARKLAGEPLPRLDLPAKSDGSFRFASDVRLPRMIFASVRMAPPGGRLVGFSRESAMRQQGAIDLVVRDQWLAALGQTWWAADHALTRAAPRFSGSETPDVGESLAGLWEAGDSLRLFERGDYGEATGGSTPLAATYYSAPLPHHSLEAPAAVARFATDRLEVWAATQVPDLARARAAKAGDVAESDVELYPMPVGDGSGSAFGMDAVTIAVELAKLSGRPVGLSFPPATAQNQDSVRSPMLMRMTALPSPEGQVRAWGAKVVGSSGLHSSIAHAQEDIPPGFHASGGVPPYNIPNIRIDTIAANLPIRTGYMRGGEEAMLTFAIESFIDELARALHAEPLAFRIGMLGGSPRLAKAMMAAAKIGGWDGGAPGSNLGLACASLYGSHIGLMAEATIGADQRIKVSRLVAAVDAGTIVNSGLVRQQIEGGLLGALAAVVVPAPQYVAGMPRATPMRGKGFERLHEVPKIEIELIPSDEPVGGVSGLGMAVLAPAVANAVAAGTGRRLRNLPFDPMSAS